MSYIFYLILFIQAKKQDRERDIIIKNSYKKTKFTKK